MKWKSRPILRKSYFLKRGPRSHEFEKLSFSGSCGSVIIVPHYITKNYELCVVFGLDVSWSSWMLFESSIFLRYLNSVLCIAWLVKQRYLAKDHELCMSWMIGSRNLSLIWVWFSKTMVDLCILELWAVCCVWVGRWVVDLKECLSMVDLCILELWAVCCVRVGCWVDAYQW